MWPVYSFLALSSISHWQSTLMVLHKCLDQGYNVKKEQSIENWLWQGINGTGFAEVCHTQVSSFSMSNSTETSSTKASSISSKATLIEKTVKKGAKIITQQFKRFKQSLSTTSMSHLTTSCPSTVLLPFDDDDDDDDKSVRSVHNKSESEPGLTAEQELGTSLI